MKAEQNELVTRIGPGTPCGAVLRQYWQPVALVDEFDPQLDPRMAQRPVKAVRVLGQDLVLFRDQQGRWGLLDRDCPHRGADLSFGRHEGDGLRCPFHGWKFDAAGACLETPAEPTGSKLCERVRQRSYPVVEQSGILFGWFGEPGTEPPPFPQFDCFVAPSTHTFAFKGLWNANWLQAFEVGIDPAHPSFLHRFLNDAALVPVDDTHTYWYSVFTSFAGPVDKAAMRNQRTQFISLPDYIPKAGRHNRWGFNADEQRTTTYLGMGEEDINVHDQWAVESMGPIQDRTREHLGTSDKVIMANRRMLLKAIETVQAGGTAPGVADAALAPQMQGPDTVDGIAPAGEWPTWWQERVRHRRDGAPWIAKAPTAAETA